MWKSAWNYSHSDWFCRVRIFKTHWILHWYHKLKSIFRKFRRDTSSIYVMVCEQSMNFNIYLWIQFKWVKLCVRMCALICTLYLFTDTIENYAYDKRKSIERVQLEFRCTILCLFPAWKHFYLHFLSAYRMPTRCTCTNCCAGGLWLSLIFLSSFSHSPFLLLCWLISHVWRNMNSTIICTVNNVSRMRRSQSKKVA